MTAPDPLAAYYATEYHRRNMQVARVCGAQASVDQALARAQMVKGIPKWLIAYLESAAERLPGLQHDLAAWRDLVPDAPDYVRTPTPLAAALAVPEVRALVEAAHPIAFWTIGEMLADDPKVAAEYPHLSRAILDLRAALAALAGKDGAP